VETSGDPRNFIIWGRGGGVRPPSPTARRRGSASILRSEEEGFNAALRMALSVGRNGNRQGLQHKNLLFIYASAHS